LRHVTSIVGLRFYVLARVFRSGMRLIRARARLSWELARLALFTLLPILIIALFIPITLNKIITTTITIPPKKKKVTPI
jgi:hypothetical protein